jgi:hypothetical protein
LVRQLVLDIDAGPHGFDGACELDHDAVTGTPEDAAAVIGDDLFDKSMAESEGGVRALLIMFHEAAVADHVRGHNGRKATLRAFLSHAPPMPSENALTEIVLARFGGVYRA